MNKNIFYEIVVRSTHWLLASKITAFTILLTPIGLEWLEEHLWLSGFLPRVIKDTGYNPSRYSYVSFEVVGQHMSWSKAIIIIVINGDRLQTVADPRGARASCAHPLFFRKYFKKSLKLAKIYKKPWAPPPFLRSWIRHC